MNAQALDAERLQEIASAFYGNVLARDQAREAVIDVVFERIGCARVSLWKFEGEGADLSLLGFAAKAAGGALDTTEQRLLADEYSAYFNGLIERGTYVSSDAMNDPGLQPMRKPYLVANNVLSMLDAVIAVNGRAYGMVCCEETVAPRAWRAGDVFALRAIVNRLAMLMAAADDPVLWSNPSLPLRALAPSRSPAPAPSSPTDRRAGSSGENKPA